VAVTAGGNSRVFEVDELLTASLTGLMIAGGRAIEGGGLANYGATTLSDSTVSGNSASGSGGGLYNSSSGSATLSDSTVSGNSAQDGGGLCNDGGSVTLTDCTVSGNSAGSQGGGLFNNGGAAAMALTNCTVSGNDSGSLGGGVMNIVGTATLINCTISGNYTNYDGGGLYNYRGTVTLTNTIVAGNSSSSGASDTGGYSAVSGSFNLIGIGGSSGLVNGDDGNLVGVADPGLAPLGNFGGPTETMALLPASPAIDAGTSGAGIPTTDQRGLGAVGGTDIGAFESQGFTLTVVPDGTPQSATIGTEFANPLAVVVTANNPIEPVDGGVISFAAIPASNGASAFLSTSSAVIAGGQVAVTAAPNDFDGSYTVVASMSIYRERSI
jgi:parallel beta-helix repeat protein